jgi:hypothetical protein
MGFSDEKIEYSEGLDLDAQEGSVRRVEDEGIKYKLRPVAHLPPLWGWERRVQPQLLQKFYDRTIATNGRSVSISAAL